MNLLLSGSIPLLVEIDFLVIYSRLLPVIDYETLTLSWRLLLLEFVALVSPPVFLPKPIDSLAVFVAPSRVYFMSLPATVWLGS